MNFYTEDKVSSEIIKISKVLFQVMYPGIYCLNKALLKSFKSSSGDYRDRIIFIDENDEKEFYKDLKKRIIYIKRLWFKESGVHWALDILLSNNFEIRADYNASGYSLKFAKDGNFKDERKYESKSNKYFLNKNCFLYYLSDLHILFDENFLKTIKYLSEEYCTVEYHLFSHNCRQYAFMIYNLIKYFDLLKKHTKDRISSILVNMNIVIREIG